MGYLRAYGPMRSEEQMALRPSSVLAPRSPDGLPSCPGTEQGTAVARAAPIGHGLAAGSCGLGQQRRATGHLARMRYATHGAGPRQ